MWNNGGMMDPRPVVGVDLGGTKVLVGVVSPDGTIQSRVKHRTHALRDQPDALLDLIARAVREALEAAQLGASDVGGVGMGVPGPLDATRRVVRVAPNLGWHGLAAADELSGRLDGMSVALENDVRSATLAELWMGAGKGVDAFLAVFVGTGVGGGLVLGGRMWHGRHGAAGEVGHLVVRDGGPRCSCGRRGCLEANAARPAIARWIAKRADRGKATALTRLAKGRDLREVTSGALAAAMDQQDPLVVRAVERSARYVGRAVGGLVNVFDPELVVLGGGVVDAVGQPYVDVAAREARALILSDQARDLPIQASPLGDDAGLLGAALTAFAGAQATHAAE